MKTNIIKTDITKLGELELVKPLSYPEVDVNYMIMTMKNVVMNRELLRNIGPTIASYTHQNFNWELIGNKLLNHLKSKAEEEDTL
jgi:hypothetical protein